jgi:hypothetical protein
MIETTVQGRHRQIALYAAALILLWAASATLVCLDLGLFDWLGVDFALFSTGVRLFAEGRPAAIFDLSALGKAVKPFLAYIYNVPDEIACGPIPHQAVTFLWYAPFAFLRPSLGYLLWVVMNLTVAALVVRRLVDRFTEPSWALTALLLTFFPLAYTVFVGQPIVIMLLAFAQAYRAWERERDFEAGLWCGVLALKIQYPVFIALVLIAKGRWRSVAGIICSTLAIFLSSWAVFGTQGMLDFLATMRSLTGFRAVHPFICPRQMINWRGLLVNVMPMGTSESLGLGLTMALSVLTASALLVVWRGRWDPSSPRFASQMLATMLVTMLANFHNHIHGATLLLVPAVVMMAQGNVRPSMALLFRIALYAPILLFFLSLRAQYVTFFMIGLMVTALLLIVEEALVPDRVSRPLPALIDA